MNTSNIKTEDVRRKRVALDYTFESFKDYPHAYEIFKRGDRKGLDLLIELSKTSPFPAFQLARSYEIGFTDYDRTLKFETDKYQSIKYYKIAATLGHGESSRYLFLYYCSLVLKAIREKEDYSHLLFNISESLDLIEKSAPLDYYYYKFIFHAINDKKLLPKETRIMSVSCLQIDFISEIGEIAISNIKNYKHLLKQYLINTHSSFQGEYPEKYVEILQSGEFNSKDLKEIKKKRKLNHHVHIRYDTDEVIKGSASKSKSPIIKRDAALISLIFSHEKFYDPKKLKAFIDYLLAHNNGLTDDQVTQKPTEVYKYTSLRTSLLSYSYSSLRFSTPKKFSKNNDTKDSRSKPIVEVDHNKLFELIAYILTSSSFMVIIKDVRRIIAGIDTYIQKFENNEAINSNNPFVLKEIMYELREICLIVASEILNHEQYLSNNKQRFIQSVAESLSLKKFGKYTLSELLITVANIFFKVFGEKTDTNTFILSTSLNASKDSMWSSYGQGHDGAVMELNPQKIFSKQLKKDSLKSGHVRYISMSNNSYIYKANIIHIASLIMTLNIDAKYALLYTLSGDLKRSSILTKSNQWDYEDEYRYYFNDYSSSSDEFQDVNVMPDAIRKITFGKNVSVDNIIQELDSDPELKSAFKEKLKYNKTMFLIKVDDKDFEVTHEIKSRLFNR